MPQALSKDEALLRVALLVASADGKPQPAETAVINRVLGERFLGLPGQQVQLIAASAAKDVAQAPTPDVLERVAGALPTYQERMAALHLACQVANADRRLALVETHVIAQLVAAFELRDADMAHVMGIYWPASP